MRLGFIGTGTIATAVVRGIAGEGHAITVSERGAAQSAALAAEFADVSVAGNQQVLDRSDVVFLGLMADTAGAVLGDLAFRPDHLVVSFMAGVPLDAVAAMVAPARAEAVMIPFPAIARGGSPILVRGASSLVAELFGARNRVFDLGDEAAFDACMCAQAVLSPVARMVGDAAAWLGRRIADPAQGEEFLRVLVASGLSGSECAPLIEALNTTGGYNQRLRLHMEGAGMGETLTRGLDELESGA